MRGAARTAGPENESELRPPAFLGVPLPLFVRLAGVLGPAGVLRLAGAVGPDIDTEVRRSVADDPTIGDRQTDSAAPILGRSAPGESFVLEGEPTLQPTNTAVVQGLQVMRADESGSLPILVDIDARG